MIHTEVFRDKGFDICNLLSNGLAKIDKANVAKVKLINLGREYIIVYCIVLAILMEFKFFNEVVYMYTFYFIILI